jgi:hypothetical protein
MIFADDATTGECTEAAKADRRRAYRCPIAPCKCPVTLVRPTTKARRAHFAHKESRPLCPLYESPIQTVEHWNWADSARVRRLGVLNRTQPVVPLCTDVTPRIALMLNARNIRNPGIEFLNYVATARERMVFSPGRHGTRIWSGESVHRGETYIALTRPVDRPPVDGATLRTESSDWTATEFKLPQQPTQRLDAWLESAGLTVREARVSIAEVTTLLPKANHHQLTFARGNSYGADLDVSGLGIDVKIERSSVLVSSANFKSGVRVVVTSATLFFVPHATVSALTGASRCVSLHFGALDPAQPHASMPGRKLIDVSGRWP